MDPTTLDLTSIAGIVAATIALVHLAKAALGRVPWLNQLPVALYVVLVSAGLTWLAHDVLHVLEGDLGALLLQAVWQAAAASGVLEWARAGTKPLKATSSALGRTAPWAVLIAVLLAGSVTGCAKAAPVLVQADAAVYTVLAGVQDGADALVAGGAITPAQRAAFAPQLLRALRYGAALNRAARVGSADGIASAAPPLLEALRLLQVRFSEVLPPGMGRDLVAGVERAVGLLGGVQ